jgi:plastocyanin
MSRTVRLVSVVTLSLFAAALAFAHGPGISIAHNKVEPAKLKIPVGQVVHFTNLVPMPGGHTIVADDGSFQSPPLNKGDGWHHTFEEPGIYGYHIKQHPKVKGTIIVEPAKE